MTGRRVYLEVMVNGKAVDCLLDTGSEMTLNPGYLAQAKRPVPSQIPAANGSPIEVLWLVQLPVLLQGREILVEGVASIHMAKILLGIDLLEVQEAIWDMRGGQLSMHGCVFLLKSKVDGGRVCHVVVQECRKMGISGFRPSRLHMGQDSTRLPGTRLTHRC